MASVILQNIKKVYDGGFVAVQDVDLNIKDGEFVVLVGPSGCGKSTTLRMIAGLEEISEGMLFIDDLLVNKIEANERDIAMVFQSYALYPHMNVFENIQFGIRIRGKDRELCDDMALDAAKILGLEQYLERYPKQLSGGQRQRVALGRSIVRDAKVVLMDEPLSNLDAELRAKMRTELKRIHNQYSNTTIYVTHDQIEAMTLADRIVVMNEGFIQQIGTPLELFNRPVNKFVAGFIGLPTMDFIDATIKGKKLTTAAGDEYTFKNDTALDGEYILGIRPNDVTNIKSEDSVEINFNIEFTEVHGANNIAIGTYTGNEFNYITDDYYKMNTEIKLYLPLEKIYIFDKETEARISLKLNSFNNKE